MNGKNRLPTALAIPLFALAFAAHSAPVTTAASHAAAASQGATQTTASTARAAGTTASTQPAPAKAAPLDLRPPNFFSPQWQQRLQGPTVDHSLDLPSMDYVVVTPAPEAPNTTVAPAGVGSVFWALMHPLQAWRVLAPVQPGDEFNTDHQLAMAINDPMSDCPGFRGTPNVRPVCP